MPQLRVLNISGNINLTSLPSELATCDNLRDIVFDIEYISYPSADILASGVQSILKFLDTGERAIAANSDHAIEDNLMKQSKLTTSRIMGETISSSTTQKFMEHEKLTQAQDYFLENQLHMEQQLKKAEMLKSVLEQQRQQENAVSKVQQIKDSERKKLIDDIKERKFKFKKGKKAGLKIFTILHFHFR